MALRTGAQYLDGLRDGREIWHVGERVADVTTEPGFANTARTVAAYYDFQHDPAVRDLVTYEDDDGERCHLSFIAPRSKDDLRRRGAAYAAWAEHSGGQLGRSPDYMNAAVMAVAAAREHWGQNDPVLGDHAVAMYERCRREDLCLTHTFVTPQIDRKTPLGEQEPYLNAGIVRRSENGVVVRGARVVGTLAPFSDANVSFGLPILSGENDEDYALGFWSPVDYPGLRWVCRDSYDPDRSLSDYPISGRFEEIDTVAIFDDCEIPWEWVYDYRDWRVHNFALPAMHFTEALGHHVIVKNVAKTRFLYGVAHLIADSAQTNSFVNVQIRLGDILTMLQTMESIAVAAVEAAQPDPKTGVWYANESAIQAGLRMFPEFYVRIVDHIKQIGGSNFMAAPSTATLEALGPAVERYFRGAGEDGDGKVPLFRLAWDVVGTSFAGRQELYERFFFGDAQLVRAQNYLRHDKSEAIAAVQRLLDPEGI